MIMRPAIQQQGGGSKHEDREYISDDSNPSSEIIKVLDIPHNQETIMNSLVPIVQKLSRGGFYLQDGITRDLAVGFFCESIRDFS